MISAYLILAHQHPAQVERLVRRLPENSPIFIHFSSSARQSDFKDLYERVGKYPNIEFVKRHRCYWGAYGIVAGTVELTRAALTSKRQFDYATLLSGADYPIASNEEIAQFLHENAGKEHIECFPLKRPNRWDNDEGPMSARWRYGWLHLWAHSHYRRLPIKTRPPAGLALYGGTQWWSLTRQCLQYCLSYIDSHPLYSLFFRTTLIPDEAYFQTIIGNSPFLDKVTGKEPTATIWDRPNPPYPATLAIDDLARLKSSGHLFARKFIPGESDGLMDALDALDALDSGRVGDSIIGRDAGISAPPRDVTPINS